MARAAAWRYAPDMTFAQFTSLFSGLDYAALAALLLGWAWIGWRIENPAPGRPSVSVLMAGFRRNWMHHMVTRDPRVFDAQIMGHLRQGAAFFASASMIAIGGVLAVFGNTEKLAALVGDLTAGQAPAVVWEIKILILLFFLSNAFLKYVWAHRLFGYCSVVIGSVPNTPEMPLAYPRADQAAQLNITAARSFNRAMRSTYFALASVAWVLGPLPLLVAALLTVGILYRREFASRSRTILQNVPPDTSPDKTAGKISDTAS